MPRTCTICAHPSRAAIDAALVAGDAFRNIAERFGTSATALHRHKADHLPAAVAAAHQAETVAQADDLLRQLRGLHAKSVSLLLAAERAGDLRTALAGVREARGCLDVLLEVEGELDRRAQVNVLVAHPEWLAIRTAIMDALTRHPAARQDVLSALATVDTHAAR